MQLASTVFVASVVIPQADYISSKVYTDNLVQNTLLAQNTQTEITFQWPLNTYQISQQYSFYHPALDLSTTYDDPVYAIADGIVESTTISAWGYGRYILISHNNAYYSLYAHLSKILIKAADQIKQGQVIGTIGTSGWSTGPHLHLEIKGPDGMVNPLEVLPKLETQNKAS